MPEAFHPIFDPIPIRYDGLDAANEQIDLALLGTSLQGAARLLAIAGHVALTGTYVSRAPALRVRVLAGAPRDGCYEIPATLYSVGPLLLPLASHVGREAGKKVVEAIVNYFLARNGGTESEAMQAMRLAETAVEANRDVTLKLLEVSAAISRAGSEQRPASRSFAAPVGDTATTAMLGERDGAFVVDAQAKANIEQRPEAEIGLAQPYMVKISELDTITGACKVELQGSNPGDRCDGAISDPVVNSPRSPYSAALHSQDWITVTAKPHIRDGEIEKLTISDTT